MQLTKNFNRREFESSTTAANYKINNKIPLEYEDNLMRLARMLQKIRDKYGKPIVISSGYRCPELNKKVGGVASSQHTCASAADIHSVSDSLKDNKELWDVIIRMVKENEIDARQILWEYGNINSKKGTIGMDWIHISVNDKQHYEKHNQILYIGV